MDQDTGQSRHLSDDHLLKTLVETADLDSEQRSHLESCPFCRQQAENIKRRYERLGRMAWDMVPETTRRFRVPVQAPRNRLWQLKPAAALAVTAIAILLFTVWVPRRDTGLVSPPPAVALNDEADRRLMKEIEALVDDALPVPLQYVAVASEPILTQDLIDWIVPSIDEDHETKDRQRSGGLGFPARGRKGKSTSGLACLRWWAGAKHSV